MKSIKVSEEVHAELSTRKHGGESFDRVLQRELGLVPRTVAELAQVLPDNLGRAITTLDEEYIEQDGRYRRIGRKDNPTLTLEFVSQATNKSIFEITVAPPEPDENRINHRVDINYRNPQNELERIGRLRDSKDDNVEIEYTDFETRENKPNTRSGDDVAGLIGPHVAKFIEQAYEVWGESADTHQHA